MDESPNPMMTFYKTLNVTKLVKLSKTKGLKFNMLMDYCIGKAAVDTKEFIRCLLNGKFLENLQREIKKLNI